MTDDELLKHAKSYPPKEDGRNVWTRFRPAAFVLRDKGYQWAEIAQKFVAAGESIPNVESFCASMSRVYNKHVRSLDEKRRD
ncbi:MAG: hypothetical protein ACI9R3_002431 [Verrucomicrobiales bacterium]|jgi:hypothetical protein